jgi:hypothetical protein
MGRKSKGPWWWKERGEYAVNVRGERHLLGKNKRAAETAWHALMASPEKKAVTSESLAWLMVEFLDWIIKTSRVPRRGTLSGSWRSSTPCRTFWSTS